MFWASMRNVPQKHRCGIRGYQRPEDTGVTCTCHRSFRVKQRAPHVGFAPLLLSIGDYVFPRKKAQSGLSLRVLTSFHVRQTAFFTCGLEPQRPVLTRCTARVCGRIVEEDGFCQPRCSSWCSRPLTLAHAVASGHLGFPSLVNFDTPLLKSLAAHALFLGSHRDHGSRCVGEEAGEEGRAAPQRQTRKLRIHAAVAERQPSALLLCSLSRVLNASAKLNVLSDISFPTRPWARPFGFPPDGHLLPTTRYMAGSRVLGNPLRCPPS